MKAEKTKKNEFHIKNNSYFCSLLFCEMNKRL